MCIRDRYLYFSDCFFLVRKIPHWWLLSFIILHQAFCLLKVLTKTCCFIGRFKHYCSTFQNSHIKISSVLTTISKVIFIIFEELHSHCVHCRHVCLSLGDLWHRRVLLHIYVGNACVSDWLLETVRDIVSLLTHSKDKYKLVSLWLTDCKMVCPSSD